MSPLAFFFFFFWGGGLVSLLMRLVCLFVLYVMLALWPHLSFNTSCPLFFLFVFYSFCFIVCSCFVWGTKAESRARGLADRKLVQAPPPPPPSNFIAGFPRQLFCFGSLVILDVACCYLWLFSLYLNIKIGKNSC